MRGKTDFFRNGMIVLLLCGAFFSASCSDDDESSSSLIPPAPEGLSAAPGNGQATLRWEEVSGATGYNLYFATAPGVTKENGTRRPAAGPPFTETGLNNGTTYYFIVAAEGLAGEGEASPEIRITPAPPAQGLAVAAGGTHTVVLKTNGMVWSWGRNVDGQVGDGTTARRSSPVQVNGLTGITAIAAGLDHTLALKDDGTVWSWGRNNFGQLGDGTMTNALYPVQVAGLTGITAISAGRTHSIALKDDGTVWVWGDNSFGQFGNGTRTGPASCGVPSGPDDVDLLTCSTVPLQATGLAGVTVAAVSAGAFHNVALGNDGLVRIWGNNRRHQIDNTGQDRLTPVQVTGLTGGTPTAVAAGAFHTVVLRSDGAVWTWGSNGGGQIGNGTVVDQTTPGIVTGLTGITRIAAGGAHTLVIGQDQMIRGWGDHLFGRNIDGTTIRSLSPVLTTFPTEIVGVAGGGFHAVALKADGSVWSWGDNFTGQLGDGTTADRFTPERVMAPVS